MDPERLQLYEQATGIALARANVDFTAFEHTNIEAEERRLMPKYVEAQFLRAAKEIGLKVETRADGLLRVEHVLADLRSDKRDAVRRLGQPEPSYRKLTFHKGHLEQNSHADAVLLGPGHPLYASVDERLVELLASLTGKQAVFIDIHAQTPYRLHFFEMSIRGQNSKGLPATLHAELVCIREELDPGATERFVAVQADHLIDLMAHPSPPEALPPHDLNAVTDFIKATVQAERRAAVQDERSRYAGISREYLLQSFNARFRAAQDRVMDLLSREATAPEVALARQRAEQDVKDLERTHETRLDGFKRLLVARHGPVRHVATALVLPRQDTVLDTELFDVDELLDPNLKRRIELAAEDVVIAFENSQNRECERVGHLKIGFDIRSLARPDPQTGYRDPVTGIRRIEVKGRKKGQPIRLTTNEWYKAVQLGNSYWLYVVWDPLNSPDPMPLMIQNPAKYLDQAKKEVVAARYFDIPAEAVEAAASRHSTRNE